jgi:hypothetical protein
MPRDRVLLWEMSAMHPDEVRAKPGLAYFAVAFPSFGAIACPVSTASLVWPKFFPVVALGDICPGVTSYGPR